MPGSHTESTMPGDISGLIPTHITTKEQLNEWEAENILAASRKYLGKRVSLNITPEWINKVHYHMFNETYNWAGKTRTTKVNIDDVPPSQINIELKKIIDDIAYWKKTKMDILEQSARIHHRLVWIHPFKNGNGRHARLVADIFLFNNNHPLPSWPGKNLIEKTDIREKYIKALKKADDGNYAALISFTKKLISNNLR